MRPFPAVLFVGALALALVFACAPDRPASDGAPRGSFGYETEPPPGGEEPLLELSYEGGMIKNPDPTPFVRVYPGGRVLVHYPAYMKKAGDYELQLGDEELEGLLASFADEEVLTAESEELNAMASSLRAEGEMVERPDDHGVAAVVKIQAESFTPAGREEPTMLGIDQRLVLEDMPPADAEVDPRFRPLTELARGVRALESLADRPDLERVEPPSEAPRAQGPPPGGAP